MEQAGDEEAFDFFRAHLSDQLIFRRANGKIVGKFETDVFFCTLKKNPFSSRESEDISVTQVGDHALVTLMVVGTRADDGSVHRYRNIRLFTRSADNWILQLCITTRSPACSGNAPILAGWYLAHMSH
jgi:Domain of unknown function (DUF4440)